MGRGVGLIGENLEMKLATGKGDMAIVDAQKTNVEDEKTDFYRAVVSEPVSQNVFTLNINGGFDKEAGEKMASQLISGLCKKVKIDGKGALPKCTCAELRDGATLGGKSLCIGEADPLLGGSACYPVPDGLDGKE